MRGILFLILFVLSVVLAVLFAYVCWQNGTLVHNAGAGLLGALITAHALFKRLRVELAE